MRYSVLWGILGHLADACNSAMFVDNFHFLFTVV